MAGDFAETHRRYGRGLEAWLLSRNYPGEIAAAIRQAVSDRAA